MTQSLPTLQMIYKQDGHPSSLFRVYLLFRWFNMMTTGSRTQDRHPSWQFQGHLLFRWFISWRRAHNTRTDTYRHYSESIYSSDDLIWWWQAHEPGRTAIILTTDTRRHHSKSIYSSDDLLPARTAIILMTGTRRHHCLSLPTLQMIYKLTTGSRTHDGHLSSPL
jgi:hypothetical protein